MDGSMNLEQALEERLRIINCTPADIKRFIQAHPPSSRMVPVSEQGAAAHGGRTQQLWQLRQRQQRQWQ
jgi:hypothetical protein